jgi:SAM-dependent methyltransferase
VELSKVKKIFDQLYTGIDGRALSLKGREESDLQSKSFVYGEVVPDGFYQMMMDAAPEPGHIFYDLGSGTGKAVILAHLLFDFSQCIGIELLQPLYEASADVETKYLNEIKPTIAAEVGEKTIKMIQGSFLDVDFSNADFVFMNSTCFQEDLMELLEEKLEKLRPHAHVISLSKALKSPAFYQYKHKLYEFSWGQATAYYHRKRLWKMYF